MGENRCASVPENKIKARRSKGTEGGSRMLPICRRSKELAKDTQRGFDRGRQ